MRVDPRSHVRLLMLQKHAIPPLGPWVRYFLQVSPLLLSTVSSIISFVTVKAAKNIYIYIQIDNTIEL